jgi:spermidine synthase
MKKRNRPARRVPAEETQVSRLHWPLMGLYGLSGFCVLALETLWMHQVCLWAGNTVIAATLVITVFFIAAAMGNWLGARLVERRGNSLFLYGCFELSAAVAAVGTLLVAQWIWPMVAQGPIEQAALSLLLVGPASMLSGFGFPILCESMVSSPELRTIKAGPLYGMNLLGAALGVIAGGVLLPWWLGLWFSFTVVLGLQIIGGLVACTIVKRGRFTPAKKEAWAPSTNEIDPTPARFGLGLLALSGLLSLATQVLLILWARQVLQGSVFTLTGVLSVFIAGLGVGSVLAARLRQLGVPAMELITLFASLSALMIFLVPPLGRWLITLHISFGSLGPAGMLGEALGWSLLALLPLTVCLGGIFPVAWELAGGDRNHQGMALGKMVALNKAAAGIGSCVAVFVLLPAVGLVFGTNILAWCYLAISLVAIFRGRRRFWIYPSLAAATGILAMLVTRSSPALGVMPNEKLIADYTGFYGPVCVVENQVTGSRQILLNSRQRLSGTERAMSSQWHQGWVPLLFCRDPERVLTIGMAAGISSGATLDFPIKELDAVELIPEVVRAARENFSEWNHDLFHDPRAKIIVGDGRVVLTESPGKFDVIICDLFFPTEDATANLYSRDFFQRAKDHLRPNGLFCLWLPCYQHDAQSAGIVIHTFLDVFPNAILIRSNLDPLQPVIGLLGSSQAIPVSRSYLAGRLASLAGTSIPQRSPFFRSPENAQLLFAGDLRSCHPDFSEFASTTNDYPLFSFIGPHEPRAGERLVGIPFLDWIGRRFLEPNYPSCDLGDGQPEDLLSSTRAANYYFAAAIAQVALPGDTRSPDARQSQAFQSLMQAQSLSQKVQLPDDILGR